MRYRLVSIIVKFLLRLLRACRFFWRVDLSLILTNNIERTLSLPGKLPFAGIPATPIKSLEQWLEKLHPLDSGLPMRRLGPSGDGGYLVPDDLNGIVACFSPGVNDVAGFELDCANLGMEVYMADASVECPPIVDSRFHFQKKFVGAVTEGLFCTLEDWVRNALPQRDGDLLLQMDIEGYEYETLLATSADTLKRFRIIVIEFHELEYLYCAPLFSLYRKIFEKLLQTHACVHIHPNNMCPAISVSGVELPSLAEFTFLRRDRISGSEFATTFPHLLDRDNTDKQHLALPKTLFRSGAVNDAPHESVCHQSRKSLKEVYIGAPGRFWGWPQARDGRILHQPDRMVQTPPCAAI